MKTEKAEISLFFQKTVRPFSLHVLRKSFITVDFGGLIGKSFSQAF